MQPLRGGRRVRNPEAALVRWARPLIGRPFVWGETDCGSLVRGALGTIYGVDPLPGQRWTDVRSAVRALDAVGGYQAALQAMGAAVAPVLDARAGDIALGPGSDPEGLPRASVVLPAAKALVSTRERGVEAVLLPSLLDGTTFWRLPR